MEGIGTRVTPAERTTMEQLQALSLARKLILGGGILLLIDSFFNWQSVEVLGQDYGQSAWNGFWGVFLGLMTVALVAGMIALMFGVEPPEGVPQGLIALVLGVLILVFAVIKNLTDDYSAWPSVVGIILAAVIAYGAWRNFQESGESLPSMPKAATAGGAAAGGTAATSSPPPVEAPPAPAESEPPPPHEGEQT
jgi:hypothetical protein